MKDVFDILACPKCKKDVLIEKSKHRITCKHCRLHFKIREGIPDMLVENAEKY